MAVRRRRPPRERGATDTTRSQHQSLTVEEQLRARKRAAMGLEPRRPTAPPSASQPILRPPLSGPPRLMQWGVVALFLCVLIITVGMVWRAQLYGNGSFLALLGIGPTAAVAQDSGGRSGPIRLLMRDDFDPPRLRLARHVEESHWAMGFVDGVYRIRSVRPGHLSWTTLGLFDTGPYRMVTQVTVAAESPWGYAGLLSRFQNDGTFYLFGTNGQGQYQVQLQEQEQWFTLLPWTASSHLRPAGLPNILAVEDNGHSLRFFANGELLFESQDLRLPTGDIGLAGGAQGQAGIEVNYDWLELYSIRLHN